jgi:hypothetical protein
MLMQMILEKSGDQVETLHHAQKPFVKYTFPLWILMRHLLTFSVTVESQ